MSTVPIPVVDRDYHPPLEFEGIRNKNGSLPQTCLRCQVYHVDAALAAFNTLFDRKDAPAFNAVRGEPE